MSVDLEALQSEEGLEVAPGVRVRLRSLADYRQNPENPVAHTPRNLGTIVESVQKVGAARSGLAADDTIYAGNLTSEAMALAGIEGIVEVTTDGTKWVMVNRPDLSPEQRKQAAHGDQWSAMLAEISIDQLLADMEEGIDLDGIYSEFDLKDILGDALAETETGKAPEPQIDKGAELAERYGVEVGQVWQLGEHRLAVGDCTDKAVVDAVMRGEKANAVVTDPPYGISLNTDLSDIKTNWRGWQGQGGRYEPIIGDDEPFDPSHLFRDFGDCPEMFLWGADYYAEKIPDRNDGSWLVWDKRVNEESGASLNWGLGSEFELCWSKKRHKREVIRKLWSGLYGTETQDIRERIHPAQKPIEIFEWIIERYTEEKDVVVDPYVGSGTMIVACQRLNRLACACEISPILAAICIQRLADMGLEPQLLQ